MPKFCTSALVNLHYTPAPGGGTLRAWAWAMAGTLVCASALPVHAGSEDATSLPHLLGGIIKETWGWDNKGAPVPTDLRVRVLSLAEQAARAQAEDAAQGGNSTQRPAPLWREVVISRRIDGAQLHTLGRNLLGSLQGAQGQPLTQLHYFLEEDEDDLWATQESKPASVPLGRSHLGTIFYGQTASERTRLLATSNTVPGTVVGIWLESKKDGEKKIVFRNAQGTWMRHMASHGQAETKRYTETQDRGHTLLHVVDGSEFGGFYVINLNGRLEVWAEKYRVGYANPLPPAQWGAASGSTTP